MAKPIDHKSIDEVLPQQRRSQARPGFDEERLQGQAVASAVVAEALEQRVEVEVAVGFGQAQEASASSVEGIGVGRPGRFSYDGGGERRDGVGEEFKVRRQRPGAVEHEA